MITLIIESKISEKDKKFVLSAVRFELLPFEYLWTTVRKFSEEFKLLSIEELSAISGAKARLQSFSPQFKQRAVCVPNGVDVVALKSKPTLSSRVLIGKLAEMGEEDDILVLDLGLHYYVNVLGLVISSSTKIRYAFKVETSVDNIKWNTLYDFSQYHTSNRLDLQFDPKVIRYLRLSNGLSPHLIRI